MTEHVGLTEPLQQAVPCRICRSKSVPFDTVDFNKYCSHEDFYSFGFSGVRVDYHRCTSCGCLFTEFFDGWTTRDFSERVYNADYIKVDSEYESVRPRFVARDMAKRWGDCRAARVLDYGSGAGAFADELRKLGYQDVTAYDPFSSPTLPTGKFDIVTCFEVIEHTPRPVDALRDMLAYLKDDGCIIVSQTLQPADIETVRGSWWYLGPRNGHICTFTADSLACLAQQCGLTFHLGGGPYAFSRPKPSAYASRALATMGRAHYFMPLFAPSARLPKAEIDRSIWHKAETVKEGVFRWTRSPKLTWRAIDLPHAPATLSLLLPFSDHIVPEMVNGVSVRFGAEKAILMRHGKRLLATLRVSRPSDVIEVRTHDTMTPHDLNGADDYRKLGLAILASPDSPVPVEGEEEEGDEPRPRSWRKIVGLS